MVDKMPKKINLIVDGNWDVWIDLTEKFWHLYIVAYVTLGIPLAGHLALKNWISLLSPTSSGLILSAFARH